MDLDAFIEEELNNLPTGGGKKPMVLKKPVINKDKNDSSIIKPSFVPKTKGKDPLQEQIPSNEFEMDLAPK